MKLLIAIAIMLLVYWLWKDINRHDGPQIENS